MTTNTSFRKPITMMGAIPCIGKYYTFIAAVSFSLFITSCENTSHPPDSSSTKEMINTTATDNKGELKSEKKSAANINLIHAKKGDFFKVPVFYGTDRKRSGKKDADKFYGSERNPNDYEVGIVEVSIPVDHKVGEIEAPPIWKLWNRKDSTKYILTLGVEPLDYTTFFNRVKEMVNNSDAKDAFVFVHGYNNSFDAATKRTAQLAFDLGFKGAPLMFSWPSRGTALGYTADEESVTWAIPHLNDFISRVIQQTGARKIHLIAHSMGNRALTAVLSSMQDAHKGVVFDQIILAAPDVDAETFKRDIVPKIVTIGKRITLYASSKDKALKASKEVHHDVRAGEGGDHIFIKDGIETVDASNLMTSDFFDHAYFVQSRPVIDDISKLFYFNASPQERSLTMKIVKMGKYWLFKQ